MLNGCDSVMIELSLKDEGECFQREQVLSITDKPFGRREQTDPGWSLPGDGGQRYH